MLRILMPGDLAKCTNLIGEEVEVMYATLKVLLSARGYHDVGPGAVGYRVMRKDKDLVQLDSVRIAAAS